MDLDADEPTIHGLQTLMHNGDASARSIAEAYLDRIDRIDRAGPSLRSVIEVNPEALDLADALDRERAAGYIRGPLHGIPVLVKDNIDTGDRMQTTAGSLALIGPPASADAPVVAKLRQAGAVLLGKTNLSEWANFRSTRSSSGWSGRGRQTRNAFVLDRSPGGSSSGSGAAVSANLCAVALGSETDGSIVSPSSANGIVGIKPTVGLTSRQGVIPISHTQDTVGPHARTVADAAAALSAIAESGADYTRALDAAGLQGARIGVARRLHTGYSEHTDRVFELALDALRACGAELIEDVEIPGRAELRDKFAGSDSTAERIILEYEFKTDVAAYLATRTGLPVHTLADLIRFNDDHAADEMPYFGQEIFLAAQARGSLSDELYLRAIEHTHDFAGRFARFFAEHHLEALVAPTNAPACAIDLVDGDRHLGGSAQAAAVAGFPLLTVPAGFALGQLPIGLTFMGPARSEATLIKLAYAFEQATCARRAPRFAPTLNVP